MQPFTKLVRPGVTSEGRLYCNITLRNETKGEEQRQLLSIVGAVGPMRNGTARGSCGQVVDELKSITKYAPGWDVSKAAQFHDIWKAWHLNDMHAGCIHQDARDISKMLQVPKIGYGPNYGKAREKILAGVDSFQEYQSLLADHKKLGLAIGYNTDIVGQWPQIQQAVEEGILKITYETKAAGWVYPREHVEGLLRKPCPICGHEYGNGWLYREIPQEVLEFLSALPDTDTTPAWV